MNTLCQMAWGRDREMLDLQSSRNQKWCDRHGWRYLTHHDDVYGLEMWGRFALLREAMIRTKQNDILAYLDNDAKLIGDPDIESVLLPGMDIAVGRQGREINAGVLFVRDSERLAEFLPRCLSVRHKYGHTTLPIEQCIVDQLGPMKMQDLGPEWDWWAGATGVFTPPIQIRAFHGSPWDVKVRGMRDDGV